MNVKKKLVIGAIAVGTIVGGAFAVNASNNDASHNNQYRNAVQQDVNRTITMEKASQIALAAYNGFIKEIEFDKEGNHAFFEVEMKTNDGKVELIIDAVTGDILSAKDKKQGDFSKEVVQFKNTYIAMDEASRIALSAHNGTILEIKLDDEDEFIHYEVKMKTEKGKKNFTLTQKQATSSPKKKRK